MTRATLGWGAFGLLMLAITAGEVGFFTVWNPNPAWNARAEPGIHRLSESLTGVALGARLFQDLRCADCHGPAGVGGVPNPNYIRGSAPALNVMADRLMLFDEEDAQWVIDRISAGEDPATLDAGERPPFRTYPRFRAQLESVRNVIRGGSVAGKLDPNGPAPRDMPAWGDRTTAAERDAIIAYLISLYDWGTEVSTG